MIELSKDSNAEVWKAFAGLDDPPLSLFVECRDPTHALGLLAKLPERGLAVVGTRYPQHRARELASRTVRALAGQDLIVISGLARGIDSDAHEAALEAGLPTIAVLASGTEPIYPSENTHLAERIVESGGMLISELPPATQLQKSHFIDRNRLIAAMTRATWVVQAPYRSGTLSTASKARKLGRTVYATCAFPGDDAFLGNERLIAGKPGHDDCDPAIPFFSAESLARSWLELTNLDRRHRARRQRKVLTEGRPAELAGEVIRATKAGAAPTAESLLAWASGQGWTPLEFFEAVAEADRMGWVRELGGSLVPRPGF